MKKTRTKLLSAPNNESTSSYYPTMNKLLLVFFFLSQRDTNVTIGKEQIFFSFFFYS